MTEDDGITSHEEWQEKFTRKTAGDTDSIHRGPLRGWKGKPPVPVDGNTWPLDFAAKILGASEKDLRDLVRILELAPTGTMKMSSYRRSGRNPRGYDASLLVRVWQVIEDLREDLKNT